MEAIYFILVSSIMAHLNKLEVVKLGIEEMHLLVKAFSQNPCKVIFIFWDFLMSYQIFLSPQVKGKAIITYRRLRNWRLLRTNIVCLTSCRTT